MTQAIFDADLELAPLDTVAVTTAGTPLELPVQLMGTFGWVLYVTAMDFDPETPVETYTFTLEVSDAEEGDYTAVASLAWPTTRQPGVVMLPIAGPLVTFLVSDAAWIRTTCTIGIDGAPSFTYGAFLTRYVTGGPGLAQRVGERVL